MYYCATCFTVIKSVTVYGTLKLYQFTVCQNMCTIIIYSMYYSVRGFTVIKSVLQYMEISVILSFTPSTIV